MRFFTPKLIECGNSRDEAVVNGAEAEWERTIVRSKRRWQKIKHAFPAEVRRFDAESICLHDAQILRMGREGDAFVIVAEMEPPSRNLVVLTFTLDGEPAIDRTALSGRSSGGMALWMYEEFDLDRRKRCTFEVLLTNGWSVKLPFRDFQFSVTRRIFPATEGQAVAGTRAVSQPA